MQTASELGLFFGIVFGVVLLPGLDMTYLLATTLAAGRRSGFAGILGIVAAGIVHVAVGAAGLATLLAVAPSLFNAMLLAGALYLAWIGLSLLRHGVAPANDGDAGGDKRAALIVAFRRGMLTNLLNPKAYAFMLAIFPQFVHAERGSIALQAIPLSAIIIVTQLVVYGVVVVLAARARGFLLARPRALVALGRGVGALLLLAAVASAWRGWQTLS